MEAHSLPAGVARTGVRPAEQAAARTQTESLAWRVASIVLLVAFTGFQTAYVLLRDRGSSLDEGIYVTAGLRTLDGHGLSDGYMTWFPGSLLWPVLSGLGHQVAGLDGARLLAVACLSVALASSGAAAANLFGARAGLFAIVVGVSCGPLLALAHLAVYDALAVAGLGIAFWSVTQLAASDHRRWLVVAAVAFAVAILAKYPAVLFGGPPLAGLLLALRGSRKAMDLSIFAFVSAAILIVFFLVLRGQLSSFITVRPGQNAEFGITGQMIGYGLAYFAAPVTILALAGTFAARRRAALVAALLVGLLMPPLYHLGVGGSIGDHKHVVYGFLFVFPLAGVALERTWSAGWPARVALVPLLTVVAGFGLLQMDRIDAGVPDLARSTAFLASQVQPGERLLINTSWPYTQELYANDRIRSPDAVYDVYRVNHGQHPISLCNFDWFVDAPGGSAWPKGILRTIRECGTYRKVRSDPIRITALGSELRFISYGTSATIWKNTQR